MLSTCAIETAGWLVRRPEMAPGAALKAGVAATSESLRVDEREAATVSE